jgi:hypothetical protein
MKEFNFYIDEKVTIWNRLKFHIEAKTLDEAKEKAKYMIIKDREEIDHYDSMFLYDTLEELEVKDNDDNATLELYCAEDTDLVYDNSETELVN